jgi:hypothetical protein
MKDLQQDGRMDYEQNEIQVLKEGRTEVWAHMTSTDQQLRDNSDRVYAISERVGRIEAIGLALSTVILVLQALGFIRSKT